MGSHTKHISSYVLDISRKRYWLKRYKEVKCLNCGDEINLGDIIVTKSRRCRGKQDNRDLYCFDCANELCLI